MRQERVFKDASTTRRADAADGATEARDTHAPVGQACATRSEGVVEEEEGSRRIQKRVCGRRLASAAADPYPCVEPPTPLRSGLPDARPRSARTAPGVRAVDACKELVEQSRIIVAPEALSPAKRTEQAQIRDSAVRRKPTWQLARGAGESPNVKPSATSCLRITEGGLPAINDAHTWHPYKSSLGIIEER